MFRHVILCITCAVVLAGCNLSRNASAQPSVGANGNNVRLESADATPSQAGVRSTEPATESVATPPTDEPTPDRCDSDDERPARRIRASVQIDYEMKTVEVAETIRFRNRETSPLDEIVLDVQTNQWEDSFELMELTVNDEPATHDLNLNRLSIALAEPLAIGCWLEFALKFRLQPAEIRDGLRSYRGFFGYSPRQINLGHFLPTVAARLEEEWRIHDPIGIGEQVVYDVADWDVRVEVLNSADSVVLAAPGTVKALGSGLWEITLPDSRDFALSVSEEFVVSELQVADNLTVEVYAFADAQINANGLRLDGAGHVLQEAKKALELFGQIFGPYSRDRFVIVQGDFPDGMEFTGLAFVGGAWFYRFDGTQNNYLTLISVHEIAHQWWYAKVGNDSALNPWLDEALSTYCEYLFIEKHYPADKNWWWTFRVAGYFPQGMVDSTVYEFDTAREYINAVYLRGVQMVHNLRVDIGDDAFFELLRAYLSAGDGRIADPTLLWSQLSPEQHSQTAGTRSEFLHDPNVNALFAQLETENTPPESSAKEDEP